MSSASYADPSARRQRATEEAAAWLVRLQEAPPTAKTNQAFTDWLRESPLHVAAMLQVSHTDDVLARFDGWAEASVETATFPATVVDLTSAWVKSRYFNRPRLLPRVGWAAVALAVLLGAGAGIWRLGPFGGTVYETARGELRELALQDGSHVWLGPETRLRVRWSRRERDVFLDRGGAVFKVDEDAARPFIVAAGSSRIRDVGTEFGVEQRDGAVLVTVEEGRVTVTPHVEQPGSSAIVSLTMGEQVAVPELGTVGAVRKVNAVDALAWSSGRLVFDDEPIAAAVERFDQYNRVQLKVLDPAIGELRINGSFKATDLESFLAFLNASIPLSIIRSQEGDQISITLSSRPL